jgi:flagellar basal-body rod protein FlgB
MGITDIPILSMLCTRLDWSQARQRILADNVANADTPHFRGRDLAPLKFDDQPLIASTTVPAITLTRTASSHMEGVGLGKLRTKAKMRLCTRCAQQATPSISKKR